MKKRNRRGQVVDRSSSGGLGVAEYWRRLFIENERLFAEGGGRLVMDDEDLTAALLAAFPGRKESKILRDVKRVRARYNRGALPGQRGKPRIVAHRYRVTADGTAVRISARGKVLPPEAQAPQKVRESDRVRREEEFAEATEDGPANSQKPS